MDAPTSVPVLVMVNGHPATGKTTLARALSEALGIPVFTKDHLKELLYESVGASDREASRALGRAAYALLRYIAEMLLSGGQGLVIEANFDPRFFDDWITGLEKSLSPVIIQVFLKADSEVAGHRFTARSDTGDRHPAHMDELTAEEIRERLRTPLQPLQITGPTLEFDTTDFDQFSTDQVVTQVVELCNLNSKR